MGIDTQHSGLDNWCLIYKCNLTIKSHLEKCRLIHFVRKFLWHINLDNTRWNYFAFYFLILVCTWIHSIIKQKIKFPYNLCLHTSLSVFSHQSGSFVKIVNLYWHIVATRNHSYIRIHSWCSEFGQMYYETSTVVLYRIGLLP